MLVHKQDRQQELTFPTLHIWITDFLKKKAHTLNEIKSSQLAFLSAAPTLKLRAIVTHSFIPLTLSCLRKKFLMYFHAKIIERFTLSNFLIKSLTVESKPLKLILLFCWWFIRMCIYVKFRSCFKTRNRWSRRNPAELLISNLKSGYVECLILICKYYLCKVKPIAFA